MFVPNSTGQITQSARGTMLVEVQQLILILIQ
jgi:hypothetical protein